MKAPTSAYSISGRRQGIGNEIDDDVGHGVADEEISAHDAVFEFLGQRGKVQQQAGWRRLQGNSLWVSLIYAQRQPPQRFCMPKACPDHGAIGPRKTGRELVAKILRNFGGEDVALLCVGT